MHYTYELHALANEVVSTNVTLQGEKMIAKAAELEVMQEQLIETDHSADGIELSLGDLDMVAGGGVVDVFL